MGSSRRGIAPMQYLKFHHTLIWTSILLGVESSTSVEWYSPRIRRSQVLVLACTHAWLAFGGTCTSLLDTWISCQVAFEVVKCQSRHSNFISEKVGEWLAFVQRSSPVGCSHSPQIALRTLSGSGF